MADALNPTAWGESTIEVGTPGTGQTMSDTLENIGYLLETATTVTTEDGTVLQLFAEGHKLMDMLQQEGTYTVNSTLVGIPNSARTKFWKTRIDADGKQWVQSTVSNDKFSVRLGTPRVVGSDRLLIPYSSVKLGIGYQSDQGWTAPITFTIVVGATGDMFGWDTVPTTPVATPASVTIDGDDTAAHNVTFDKSIKSFAPMGTADWLTIGGSGTAWTVTATTNSTGADRVATLTAMASDGSAVNVVVTQSPVVA